MGWLETSTGTASVLTRLLGWIFLRVLPGRYGAFVYWPFAVYVLGVLYVQQKIARLRRAEATTKSVRVRGDAGTINGQSSTSSSTSGSQQQTGGSVSSKKKKNKNKASAPNSPAGNKLSYADVAKLHTENEDEVVSKLEGDGTLASRDGSHLEVVERSVSTSSHADSDIPRRPNPFHLLLGHPSSSRSLNWLSLAINVALILCCIDFQFVPMLGLNVPNTTFVRVGAVSDTSAKLVARIPPSILTGATSARLRRAVASFTSSDPVLSQSANSSTALGLVYRPTRPRGAWLYGGILTPGEETDYVGSIKLQSLLPSTEYEYALVLPEHLEDSRLQPSIHHPHYFKTSPDPRLSKHQTHFTFAASSCIKPGFPYAPFEDHLSLRGASELADRITRDRIDFLMFMGDFIYADIPHPVHSTSAYMKKYRQTYASKDYRRVYERIPTYHIWDDHEIRNDYAGNSNDSNPWYQLADPAYQAYVGQGNPDPIKPDANYYTFNYGDAAFFVWDTRRHRSPNEAVDDEYKTMLGDEQKAHFYQWLGEVNSTATFKFVVSSVPFMTLWSGPSGNDTWAAFTTERTELMDVMQYVPNMIVLSGDRHEFAAAIIRESVLDFSISPLNQFYLPIRTLSQKHGLGKTGEDRLLKYVPDGGRKFATFEVDTRVANQPTVSVRLYVDGKKAWNLDVIGKPVLQPKPLLSVGRNLAMTLSDILGFGRGWF